MARVAKPLLDLSGYTPYRLAVAASRVSGLTGDLFARKIGLSLPQWRVVINLGSRGPMAQLQLVQQSALDKIAVSRAAAALRGRGLVTVSKGGADQRYRVLELTPAGEALYREGWPLALRLEQRLLEIAGVKDAAGLRAQLEALERAAELIRQSHFPELD